MIGYCSNFYSAVFKHRERVAIHNNLHKYSHTWAGHDNDHKVIEQQGNILKALQVPLFPSIIIDGVTITIT